MASVHSVGQVPLSSMGANHPLIPARRYYEEPAACLLMQHGGTLACLNVDCSQNAHRRFTETHAELRVGFDPNEYDSARLTSGLERRHIVEFGAIGLALLFLPYLADGEVTHVTKVNDRTDFWVDGDRMLEVSGTEEPRRLRGRHLEKVIQGGGNPHRLPYFVSVSCFGNLRSIFSFHEVP